VTSPRDLPGALADLTGLRGHGLPQLAAQAVADRLEERFAQLIEVEAALGVQLVAILVALVVGALHALAPGHGKAVAAAYFAGGQGRRRDAVALGVIVAGMHTGSVLVLGLALDMLLRGPLQPDRLTPWMMLTSGLLVMGLGTGLLVRQGRLRRRGGHAHEHHLPPGVTPFSRRGLVLIGVAGGLLPSPSAFLVLLTALATGQLVFGLALIVAFSVGLAATVAVVGIAARAGREVMRRRAESGSFARRVSAAMPLASALVILVAGLAVATTASATLWS
jgi:nickel/cobalt transporter (NicO) family protein